MLARYKGKVVNDITLVNEKGQVEYANIRTPEFFDLKPEEMLGLTIPEFYDNLDENTSTMEIAVRQGKQTLGLTQELHTKGGKIVRQTSDTLLIKNKGRVAGAFELTYYYDSKKDVIGNTESTYDESVEDISESTIDDIVGESPKITAIKAKIPKIADLNAPILIAGETGTGKELLARVIHNTGIKRDYPFVYLNCNAIPEGLLEGILFGVEKGSFTDAVESEGLFRMADRGTLFIDEIDTMPLSVQGKLLKAIEDKKVRPIGGDEEYLFGSRIIASCNHPLREIIRSSSLRHDFYYRLAVIQLELPPVCERDRDALMIARHYLEIYNRLGEGSHKTFDTSAEKFFLNDPWQGNVREVKNLVERLYYYSEKDIIAYGDIVRIIGVTDGSKDSAADAGGRAEKDYENFCLSEMTLKEYLEGQERQIIASAFEASGREIKKTASKLGISRQLLYQKMNKYDVN